MNRQKVYYREAIEQGRIKVHDNTVDPTYLIQGGDVLTHTVHRHEPAVAVSLPNYPFVKIVTETNDLVVVDKPGTLPIHACGGYHRNALMSLLEEEGKAGRKKLYTIHRLDRLTSGLVLLAKSSLVAQQWAKSIQERSCQKVYLARVKGKFPQHLPSLPFLKDSSQRLPNCGEWSSSNSISDTNNKEDSMEALRRKHAVAYWIIDSTGTHRTDMELSDLLSPSYSYSLEEWMNQLEIMPRSVIEATPSPTTTGATSLTSATTTARNMLWLTLACPTRVAQHKDGICQAGAFDELDDELYRKTVKPAQTSMAAIQYDPLTDSTIVLCRPETGRTHQIRLHLQYLGHPIANDPNYGGELWYADPNGQAAFDYARSQLDASGDEVSSSVEASSSATMNVAPMPTKVLDAPTTTDVPATEEEMCQLSQVQRNVDESAEDFIQRTCVWCARSRGGEVNRTFLEFLVRSRGIWLHAIQYSMVNAKGEPVSYRTNAAPDWGTIQH